MKQVVIVVPKGEVNLGTVTGSLEVLRSANAYWKKTERNPRLEISVAGTMKRIKLTAGTFSIHPKNITEIKKADLIIIPAVFYTDDLAKENKELISWILKQYGKGAEIATMCSGAFLLAATGLLDGKTCSTHWAWATDFKRMFPNVNLLEGKLITSENGIYTNGGAYSFLNLMVYLVEKYFNRDTAIYCSKVFQIDMDRTSQLPFSIFETQKQHGDELISRAQMFIEEHFDEKISFSELASTLAASRRNFDRRFYKATNNTPLQYQHRVQVEFAKSNLEKSKKNIFEVMCEVGYSDDKAFRELFRKMTGLSPLEYRSKYNNVSF
jgi:transcriptional regulator GlxA family with amidase domain